MDKATELKKQLSLLTWAQFYALNKISFIPVAYRSKKPTVEWKQYQERKPTLEETLAWFDNDKKKNIGVVCGEPSENLAVIDFDSMEAFNKAMGKEWLDKTFCVKTNRGVHVWVKTKEPVSTQHHVLKEGGVDVIGKGGFAIAPPSKHPTGRRYTLISNTLDITTLEDFDFLKKLTPIKEEHKQITLANKIQAGERNNSAFMLACSLRRNDYSKQEVTDKLIKWNAKKCNPALELNELTTLIDSAFKEDYTPSHHDTITKTVHETIDLSLFEAGHPAAHLFAIRIIEVNPRIITFSDTSEMYKYENGIYIPAEALIESQAQKLYGKASKHLVSEIIGQMKRRTFVDRKIVKQDVSLLCLENGVFDLELGELQPHDPNIIFLSKLPIEYKPNVDCTTFKAFLNDILDEKDLDLIQEMFGYLLLRDVRFEKQFVLLGKGANGKSTLIKVLTRFLGIENVAGESMQSLASDTFAPARLFEKYANLYADLSAKAMRETGILKMIVSGDLVSGNRKYKDELKFHPFAKHIFSANELPKTQDDTDAFFRRLILVNFPNQFMPDNPKTNPNILAELTTTEEMQGIFNWAYEGFKRLLENNKFSYSASLDQVRKQYLWASDSLRAFIDEEVEVSNGVFVSKDQLYRKYAEFCNEFKLQADGKTKVSQNIQSIIPSIEAGMTAIEGKSTRIWRNIKFKEEQENSGSEVILDYTLHTI